MRNAEVVRLSFEREDDRSPYPTLGMEIQGHFDQAARVAHDLAGIILGPFGAWRFTQISYEAPALSEFDSNGIFTIRAQCKEPNHARVERLSRV